MGNGTETPANIPVDVTGVVGATSITAGGYISGHTCALMAGGTVKCWGENFTGQLGNGTENHSNTPVDVIGAASATAVTAGGKHSCAVVAGGTVKCWGDNFYGQLGSGSILSSTTAVPVVR